MHRTGAQDAEFAEVGASPKLCAVESAAFLAVSAPVR